MHDLYSVAPERGATYLRAVLPVNFRCHAHYTGQTHTYSAAEGASEPGYYFLTPHATVIAAHRLEDRTPVLDIVVGERLRIDGVEYQVRDDKPLAYPRLARIVTTVTR